MSHYNLNFTDTYTIVDKKRLFSIEKCWQYLLEQGKMVYGEHFRLTKEHKNVIYKLLIYAIEDEQEMRNLGLDPRKGILLMGEPMSGKTAMFRLTKSFYANKKKYDLKSCRLLSQGFVLNGFESLAPLFAPNAKVLVLDNMGKENNARHYGYTCDVVANIVEHFYEQRHDLEYPRLHINTALTPEEIGKKYGPEFRNMLKEMFNVVINNSRPLIEKGMV